MASRYQPLLLQGAERRVDASQPQADEPPTAAPDAFDKLEPVARYRKGLQESRFGVQGCIHRGIISEFGETTEDPAAGGRPA